MLTPAPKPNNPAVNNLIIFAFSLALGLAWHYFFYWSLLGVSFPIYITLILAALFLLAFYFKVKIKSAVYLLIAPLLFCSIMAAVRASGALTFLNVVMSLYLLLLIAAAMIGQKIRGFEIADYLKCGLKQPFQFLNSARKVSGEALTLKGIAENKEALRQVVKGVVLTAPFILLFLVLFSSADLVFEKYVTDFFNVDFFLGFIKPVIIVFIVTFIATGFFGFILLKKEENGKEKNEKQQRDLSLIVSAIFLGSVNLLFFLFVMVQIKYFFGEEVNIGVEGWTYAEYAKKGFTELAIAGVICFMVTWLCAQYAQQETKGQKLIFKILSVGLILQVGIIMASAFQRLSLYEKAYGFTAARFYGHVFMIFLGAVFLLLLYKILIDQRENIFAFSAFSAIVLFIIAMNIMNPDAFIARQNIRHFYETDQFDAFYLMRLSDDAIKEKIGALDVIDDLASRMQLAENLYGHQERLLEHRQKARWFEWHWSRGRAWQILNTRSKELKEGKEYTGKMEKVRTENPINRKVW